MFPSEFAHRASSYSSFPSNKPLVSMTQVKTWQAKSIEPIFHRILVEDQRRRNHGLSVRTSLSFSDIIDEHQIFRFLRSIQIRLQVVFVSPLAADLECFRKGNVGGTNFTDPDTTPFKIHAIVSQPCGIQDHVDMPYDGRLWKMDVPVLHSKGRVCTRIFFDLHTKSDRSGRGL